ncbi:hypothetical protein Rsub_09864 [Raphidocelis subcapitata]|uniref:Uncharacterized protein n=1 Tax=Raphidocelis subcapitata TaxID=307507 RepID=A0A2V0PC61_9CHLO|nr:hypothetical protein Rsub_09864 [Raphidocelis subcapitata]|eukprot:GBF96522.1 hypothetical protein Rsub_09864 [Raphidocelis subcapitata]
MRPAAARAATALAAVALALALALPAPAAAQCPGGAPGAGQVTGFSPLFGSDAPPSSADSQRYVDLVPAWKKYGAVSSLALFYSHADGCLVGVRTTYGDDAGSTQQLGATDGVPDTQLEMGPMEGVAKVEAQEGGPKRCVTWMRLTTNRGTSVTVGPGPAGGEVRASAANRRAGFMAALRGYESYSSRKGAEARGPLTQLQFVWGVYICPDGTAAPVPGMGEAFDPEPRLRLESGADGADAVATAASADGPGAAAGGEAAAAPSAQAPASAPARSEAPLCPAIAAQCDPAATSGAAYCPAVPPFTASECAGGCCVSSGKCRSFFCGKVGLGSEITAKDMLCWGTNGGPLNTAVNRCRGLACRLAVPGCVSDVRGGACVGTVVSLAEGHDPSMAKWLGAPCLQTVPGGLPLDALGRLDLNGAYAARLWTICNCDTPPPKPACRGPFCGLFRAPELPSLSSFGLPPINASDVGRLVDALPRDLTNLTAVLKTQNVTVLLDQLPNNLTSTLKAVLNNGSSEDAGAAGKPAKPPAGKIAVASLDGGGGGGGIETEIPEVSAVEPPPVALPAVNITALAARAKQLNLTARVAQLGRAALARPSVQGWLSRFDLHRD